MIILAPGKFYSGELTVSGEDIKKSEDVNLQKAYFAGGCFWCMEEFFDKIEGVIQSTSGYSGGHLKNPTYKEVIYKDTGHVEAIEIIYDKKIISYEELLDIFWKNIDPFDKYGQFCDKGKSYRSVVFFDNKKQKKMINVNQREYNDFINNMEAYEKYYKNDIKTILTSIIDYYRINPDGGKKNRKKEECITILNENIKYIEQNIIKS